MNGQIMNLGDLLDILSDDKRLDVIIGSVTSAIIAIAGAIGAVWVKVENAKRREHCSKPKCCLTGRNLKPKGAKPKKAKAKDAKPKG